MSELVCRILLVEDNPADARLLQELLNDFERPCRLFVATSGEEAVTLMRGGNVKPDLVILDLQMPGMSGHEVLAEIKSDPSQRQTPVIVYTSSNRLEDIQQAYQNHANCYVRKPVTLDGFGEVMEAIRRFWMSTATLPLR